MAFFCWFFKNYYCSQGLKKYISKNKLDFKSTFLTNILLKQLWKPNLAYGGFQTQTLVKGLNECCLHQAPEDGNVLPSLTAPCTHCGPQSCRQHTSSAEQISARGKGDVCMEVRYSQEEKKLLWNQEMFCALCNMHFFFPFLLLSAVLYLENKGLKLF